MVVCDSLMLSIDHSVELAPDMRRERRVGGDMNCPPRSDIELFGLHGEFMGMERAQ